MLKLLVTLLGSAALWILFVAGVKPQEMIVGCICTLLTLAFTCSIALHSSLEIRLRFSDMIQIWRFPEYMVTGVWEILSVLVLDILHISPAESLFRAAPFEENEDTPVAIARRVLAVAYTTATPNFIIVGIDMKTRWMLFHQLKKSDVLTMTRRLGAKA